MSVRTCLLLGLASCASVHVPEGAFSCEEAVDCPRNWVCSDGRCYRDPPRSDGGGDGAVRVDASSDSAMVPDGTLSDTPIDAFEQLDAFDGGVDSGPAMDACVSSGPEVCGDELDNDCDPSTLDACCPSGWDRVGDLCRSPQRGPVTTCRQAINDCMGEGGCPASPEAALGYTGSAYVVTNSRRCRRHNFTDGARGGGSDVGIDESVGSFPYWCVTQPLQQIRQPCTDSAHCPPDHECNSGSCRAVPASGVRCCENQECGTFCTAHLAGDLGWPGDRSAVAIGICD